MLQILKTVPEGSKLSWDTLNKYMRKAGVPQFDFDTFKAAYDSTPQLQDLVKFGPKGVTVYADSTDKLPQADKKADSDDEVEKMAKRASQF